MRLAFNPYTYVRVAVMRTLLIKPEGYHKMLKMSFAEMAESLRQTTYKQEIEALALRYQGAMLLEHALNLNLKKTYEKLMRISDEALREVIKAYLFRNDIWNLKTIIRSKTTKMGDDEIKDMLLPGTLKNLDALMKKQTVVEVIKASGLFESAFVDDLKAVKDNVVMLENSLDKEYFHRMDRFASTLSQGGIMREFLKAEIEVTNILTLMKLKEFGLPDERIEAFVIEGRIPKKALKAKDRQAVVERLKGTPYYAVLKQNKEHLFAEAELKRHLLKRTVTLLHKNQLTVDVILAYLLAKEIEILNLKRLIKGKQLGVEDAVIERVLIT
ncbi:MAG: V-type ATPase subunit [Nanoarchaeota archaeon]